jgi:ribonuclease T1
MSRCCLRFALRSLLLIGVVLVALPFAAAVSGSASWSPLPIAQARESRDIGVISVAELPREAREVLRRIEQGGPFAYEKDGTVFGNYERQLPSKPRGYYREYTVPTPGAHDRGARRIVCGGARTHPEVCYYTHDHYASFRRITN